MPLLHNTPPPPQTHLLIQNVQSRDSSVARVEGRGGLSSLSDNASDSQQEQEQPRCAHGAASVIACHYRCPDLSNPVPSHELQGGRHPGADASCVEIRGGRARRRGGPGGTTSPGVCTMEVLLQAACPGGEERGGAGGGPVVCWVFCGGVPTHEPEK
jgi:hypothetical protein